MGKLGAGARRSEAVMGSGSASQGIRHVTALPSGSFHVVGCRPADAQGGPLEAGVRGLLSESPVNVHEELESTRGRVLLHQGPQPSRNSYCLLEGEGAVRQERRAPGEGGRRADPGQLALLQGPRRAPCSRERWAIPPAAAGPVSGGLVGAQGAERGWASAAIAPAPGQGTLGERAAAQLRAQARHPGAAPQRLR